MCMHKDTCCLFSLFLLSFSLFVSSSDERLLTTKAMRQAELEERHRQYDHVVMRIQFPDGLVLQGCFRPRETGACLLLGRDLFPFDLFFCPSSLVSALLCHLSGFRCCGLEPCLPDLLAVVSFSSSCVFLFL